MRFQFLGLTKSNVIRFSILNQTEAYKNIGLCVEENKEVAAVFISPNFSLNLADFVLSYVEV